MTEFRTLLEDCRTLCEDLETRWCGLDYADDAFPALAVAALEKASLSGRLTAADLLHWIARESFLPRQTDPASSFGDLALTLCEAPRFHLSALFWLESSTAIHQHSFDGAFQVLDGSSLHTRYGFEAETPVNASFQLGRLDIEGVELLPEGRIEPIRAGAGFIHALFHLERPAVSLVLRTGARADAKPQWSYEPNGISYDPFLANPVRQKKLEALRIFRAHGPEIMVAEAKGMLERADLQLTWEILGSCFDGLEGSEIEKSFGLHLRAEHFPGLLEVARTRHAAEVIDRMEGALEERERQNRLLTLRRVIQPPEQRFLIGVLLNTHDPRHALELLRERYPDGDPVEELLDRVDELAVTKIHGAEGHVLGIEDYDAEHRLVLRSFLEGGGVEQAADRLVAQTDEPAEEMRALALNLVEDLRGSPLLRRLVS